MPQGSYQPSKVLGATYSPKDRMLWVLDEVKHSGLWRFARLVRVARGEPR